MYMTDIKGNLHNIWYMQKSMKVHQNKADFSAEGDKEQLYQKGLLSLLILENMAFHIINTLPKYQNFVCHLIGNFL